MTRQELDIISDMLAVQVRHQNYISTLQTAMLQLSNRVKLLEIDAGAMARQLEELQQAVIDLEGTKQDLEGY